MNAITITELTPQDLENLIKKTFEDYLTATGKQQKENTPPHLTRKQAAQFFGVSVNCINDWCNREILKPYKVGQRTYFKRSHCEEVLFSQPKSI